MKMRIKLNFMNHILLAALLSSCAQRDQSAVAVGMIKPIPALEIPGSDLWIGGEVLDRDLCSYDAYKSYLGQLGAKKIRLQSGWAKTEKEKGKYDFGWLEHIVDDALSRGVQPWIQISYGNPIYPGGGGVSLGQGLVTSDEALEAFARYTEALVRKFQDRVREWEIWNEADLRHNVALGHDENTYARLFVRTAETVRSVQPNARIVALSLAHAGGEEFVDGFFRYLEERQKLGLVDVITFHGYPRNPDQGFDNVDKLVAVASRYKRGIAFWQGETGCPSTFGSTGALSGHPWTELTQAKWDTRRALAHLGRGYPFSLFLLSEFVYNDALRKGLNSKGILKIDENDFSILYAKPAYHAYQNLTSIFTHELSLNKDLEIKVLSDSSVSVFGWQDKHGSKLIGYWTDSSIPYDSTHGHKISLQMKEISFDEPVLVNTLSGEIFSLPRRWLMRQDNQLLVKGIPCYDFPMLLAEKALLPIDNINY